MSNCLKLKKSNCKNCYKCIRHCPVKSIRFSGNQAHIVDNECILCGECFVVCPQNAKEIVDESEKVKVFIQSGDPVYASIAPAFIANYPGAGINSIREALKKIGFFDVEETALGATIVKTEYERMLREEDRNILISSCCHSLNLLVQKYFKNSLQYLADVVSPMQAHCLDIKRRNPKAKTVFIGPCVAKKDEAEHYKGIVDAVITFEELTNWLKAENIEINKELDNNDESKARFFPTTGGILKTMSKDMPQYTYIAVDGVENCISALKDIEKGNLDKCFIEMSICSGSCIGGPVMDKRNSSPIRDYKSIASYAGTKDFNVLQPEPSHLYKYFEHIEQKLTYPASTEIQSILKKMGKIKVEDELNCGSCGYNTCKEKAIAIYQGKADLSMCLPFLKDKAENFSDTIVKNSPNGLIVLNEELEVQQINKAACRILNIENSGYIMGEPVVRILDPTLFMEVKYNGKTIRDVKSYLADYNRYVEQSIIYDKDYHVLISVMRDITEQERERERKERISKQTVDIADKVVDKQMRIVQEIASLLGETAAETKIALTKLKESIKDE